jgi:thioredoxin-like negative regulator of GroEL
VFVDPDHFVAEQFGIVNIPTVVWIDEDDRIVRTPVIAPVDDLFRDFTNVDSAVHHEQLRAWVRDGVLPYGADEARQRVTETSDDDQLARVERRLGAALHRMGRDDRAAVHLARAAELSPMDFTIRRGTLPLRGSDPFGAEFFAFVEEWIAAGTPGYGSADKGA